MSDLIKRIIDRGARDLFYCKYFLAQKGIFENPSWENLEVNFIVSTGRTGTRYLAELFNPLEGITALHEPDPDFLKLGIGFSEEAIEHFIARKRIIDGRRLILKGLYDNGSTVYIESNNRLFSLIPVLVDIFPKCRIVHIIRDGRDIVRSGMSRFWYREDDLFPRLKATDFPGDPYCDGWDELDRFEKICWWWPKKDGIIHDGVEKYKNNCMTVKFEDIFDYENNNPGLKKIVNFFELDSNIKLNRPKEKKSNETKEYQMPHWKDWESDLKEKFMKIAGDYMVRHHYLKDGEQW